MNLLCSVKYLLICFILCGFSSTLLGQSLQKKSQVSSSGMLKVADDSRKSEANVKPAVEIKELKVNAEIGNKLVTPRPNNNLLRANGDIPNSAITQEMLLEMISTNAKAMENWISLTDAEKNNYMEHPALFYRLFVGKR